MKLLFICNEGRNRSKTAAILYENAHEVDSTGLYLAITPEVEEKLLWADYIFVMESHHQTHLQTFFPQLQDKVFCLDIPDIYPFGDAELKAVLKKKIDVLLAEVS